jgi:hypothetical protein
MGAAALAAIVYLVGSRGLKPQRTAGSDYVNPALCSGCHPLIAKSYLLSGMGRSFYRPRIETTIEDYKTRNEFYHRASGRYYTMLYRDGKFIQQRHQTGPEGNTTNILRWKFIM